MRPYALSVSETFRVVLHAVAAALSIVTLGYLIKLVLKGSSTLAFYFVVVCLIILLNVTGLFAILNGRNSQTRTQYPSSACMVALDYVAMVLIVVSIIVNALAQIGESSDGDDNVPHRDHFLSVPFYLLIVIGVLHLILSIFACVNWCQGRKKRRVGQTYADNRNELDRL